MQAANSPANEAMKQLRKTGWTGYGKKQLLAHITKLFIVHVPLVIGKQKYSFSFGKHFKSVAYGT
jgi:hypothetical protein